MSLLRPPRLPITEPAISALLCLVLIISGCSRTFSAQELAALASAGKSLNDTAVELGPVPSSRWPLAFVKLQPEQVYRTADGVYITTDSFFVEERGLFIPDSPTECLPGQASDPGYERLGDGIFAYTIKG
jgi:hypothetical protein